MKRRWSNQRVEGKMLISGVWYRIARKTPLMYRNERHNGLHHRHLKRIDIDGSLGRMKTMESLAHEIMHACYIHDDTGDMHDRIYAAAWAIAKAAEKVYG